MPRAKRLSDEIYNIRRRAKRAAARTGQNINEILAQTYQSAKRAGSYSPQALRELAEIAATSEITYKTTQKRNKAFAEELRKLNSPEEGQSSLLSSGKDIVDQTKVAIFFQSTRSAWEGRDPTRRYDYIIRALNKRYGNVTTLEQAWALVMQKNRAALDAMTATYETTDSGGFQPESFPPMGPHAVALAVNAFI